MSSFLLPKTCRAPQRSMLLHFVTPVILSSRTGRATTTRSRASLVSSTCPSLDTTHVHSSSYSSPPPFMIHATTNHSEATLFAPQYQYFQYTPPTTSSKAMRHHQAHTQHNHQHITSHKKPSSETSRRSSSKSIQFDRTFLDLARRRLEEKHHVSHHFDYCKDKPLREAAVFMVNE